ncbi:hypothetical protein NDU88_004139 [Pleurodeles waltl]|uniref:Uncharacterized protein n=1 Tax=Pleurodeles waltl TaxID=8319 RepID=A0AAV7W861_PLEWA|nr:hypothetical protein NDU88_004139 [Pleurodeles waltl]
MVCPGRGSSGDRGPNWDGARPAAGVPDPERGEAWTSILGESLPPRWRERGGKLTEEIQRPEPPRGRQTMPTQGPGRVNETRGCLLPSLHRTTRRNLPRSKALDITLKSRT